MVDEKVKKYVSIVPTTVQKSIQRDGFNVFVHYGLNTFANKEWSDGTISPEVFNPTEQNTDQWAGLFKHIGAKGVILTAKHHDGFCLWQTKTTEYSIKNSPYKDGKGDVVKELSDSCRKFGLKFGVYLSPWDRNSEYYGTDKYDDYYCAQLTELLTGYGDIFCVWLDGACGAEADGKKKQEYDFERYFALIRKLSPKTVISNCGPDVRWVGNEGGYARKSEWNVIPVMDSRQKTIESSQKTENQNMKRALDCMTVDLGSRKVLEGFNEYMWSPAEVDVSVRPGWFYHKNQDMRVRSVNNLTRIYLNSVGGNSLLLLNVPPDTTGRINDADVAKLLKFSEKISVAFSKPLSIKEITAPKHEGSNKIRNVLVYSYNKNSYDANSYYTPAEVSDSYEIELTLDGIHKVDKVRLVENTAFSQRVEKFRIYAYVGEKWSEVYSGTTIGYNRIALLNKVVKTDRLKIVIEECRDKPYIEYICAYEYACHLPGPTIGERVKTVIEKATGRK